MVPRRVGALIHRGRRRLHPRRRGPVRVVLHGVSAVPTRQAGKRVREAVGATSGAPGATSVHAVVGPAL